MIRKFICKWEVLITIIISVTSIFVAVKANEMTRIQTEVAKNSSLPNIQVVETKGTNELNNNDDGSVIEISNLEGRINNYSSRVITFLKCSYLDQKDNFYESEVPVFNYYIIGSQSGKSTGILEEKSTAGNSKKIENLLKKIVEYNKTMDTNLYAEVESYLCISYMDILGEEQEVYYLTDVFDTQLIDEKEGRSKFQIYDELSELNEGVDPNIVDNIDVKLLINKICDVSSLNIEEKIDKMAVQRRNDGVMVEIIGVFLAAFLAYILWLVQERKKDKEIKSHASSILYYDLKSIETYLKRERSSVNLRYSSEWQQMIANCSFLKDKQVEEIYVIYDMVYNYNYYYKLVENKHQTVRKEDIPQYEKLKEIFIENSEENKRYKEILKELREHIFPQANIQSTGEC